MINILFILPQVIACGILMVKFQINIVEIDKNNKPGAKVNYQKLKGEKLKIYDFTVPNILLVIIVIHIFKGYFKLAT